MEPHDLHSYRMPWSRHNSSAEIVAEEVYEDGEDDVIEEDYNLVGEEIIPTNEINAISNTLDQSAAQNLIYMAQEGNVMAMGDLIEEQVEQAENGDYNDQEYFECQVTEEVITDDWVQRQGEERIEIIIDSIESGQAAEAVNTRHADDEIDVSLPTEQDEYTASRPYPCDYCNRRFRKKANLINHMVAHQQDRPHACNLCGARYIRRNDLIQHLRVHAYIPEEGDEEHASDQETKPLQRTGSGRRGGAGKASSSAATTGLGRGGLGKSKPPPFDHLIEDDVKLLCDVANQSQQSLDSDHNGERQPRFPIIDDKRPFVCQQCGLSFSREKALLSHTKTHGMDTQFECEHCGEMFYDQVLLREHEFSHSNAIEYDEPASSSHYSHHQQQETEEEEFDDEDNDGTYRPEKLGRRQISQLHDLADMEHSQGDEDEEDEDYQAGGGGGGVDDNGSEFGIYYCDHCGMSFHRVNLLRQHIKTHLRQMRVTASTEHMCNVCGQSFEEALDLLAHAEVHARHQCVKCLLCGEEVSDDNRLEQHVQTMHKLELNATMCGVCGKQCKDDKSLQKHCFEHSTAMKKVLCPICKKTFQNKGRLKRHLLSHRKRTVQCDICMEEFQDGRTLMNHRHSHTTGLVKKFPCKECGKSFGSRSSQQIHVRMHTGERPYGCRYCWKSFADGGTLRKHERIHTGEKPYGCVICPRAFNQRVVLREHIRSHHSAPEQSRSGMSTPFYCQLCHNSYYKAEELISDLIAHCDENTKRSRPVQVGPRKYKRRRKLKPHELKMMSKYSGNEQEDDEEEEFNNQVDSDACTEDARQSSASVVASAAARGKRGGKTTSAAVVENDHYYDSLGGSTFDPVEIEEKPQVPLARIVPSRTGAGMSGGKGRMLEAAAYNSTGRPKMIHTEKSRVAAGDGKRKTVTTTRSTPRVTATVAHAAAASVALGTRRSRRILEEVVKKEVQDEEEEEEQPQGLVMSSMELADVLGDKKNSDKYSVDIVNDLESILCSPIRPRVSESSTTAPDYGSIGVGSGKTSKGKMMVQYDEEDEDTAGDVTNDDDREEEEEVEVDVEPPQQKKPRHTIIECRRSYITTTEDRSKSKPPVGGGSGGKQYTAKIATASAGQYGIVRVNSQKGNSNSLSNSTSSSLGRINIQRYAQQKPPPVKIKNEIYSTTEDEGETLDDLLLSTSGKGRSEDIEFVDVGGEEQRQGGKRKSIDLNRCQICNIVMTDKHELLKHARTHF